jgi:hypothetical protein
MKLESVDFASVCSMPVRSFVLAVSWILLSIGFTNLRAQESALNQTPTPIATTVSIDNLVSLSPDSIVDNRGELNRLTRLLEKTYTSPFFYYASLNRVVQDFRMWQSICQPFVSANTNPVYSPRSATFRLFDPTNYPPDLVARLVPEKYEESAIVYRLSVYQDSGTLEYVFLNGNAEEIWREPTTVKKDPWFWLRLRHPWALVQNTDAAQSMRMLYDPARIRFDYLLLPVNEVPDFALTLALASLLRRADQECLDARAQTRTMNLRTVPPDEFSITALSVADQTVNLEIHLPDGTNCQVDVLYTSALPGFPWSLMTTTPATSGTVQVQFTCSLSNAFFRAGNADIDTDGDGIPDDREIFMYGTDPTKWDTDGDGISDFAEIFVYGTDPNNPDTTPPIVTILTPVDGEWKAVLP